MQMLIVIFMFFMMIIKGYIFVIKMLFYVLRFCFTGRVGRVSARRAYRR